MDLMCVEAIPEISRARGYRLAATVLVVGFVSLVYVTLVRVNPAMAQVTPPEERGVSGFATLPAPSQVSDADLSGVFKRYMEAYQDPRQLEGRPGANCGSYAGVPCVPVIRFCVRDLKWGCPDDDFFARFLPPFRALLLRMLGDRFATGQGVYAFLGLARVEEAAALAEACVVSASWCFMLDGVVAYEQGRYEDASEAFQGSFLTMPEEDACAFSDLKWLFQQTRAYRDITCAGRSATNEVIWWLSDPLWSVAGNSRRLAHWNRTALNILHDDFLELETASGAVVDNVGHPLSHHNSTTRFGLDGADGVSRDPSRGGSWDPTRATRSHFVPRYDAVLDPLSASHSSWELTPDRPWELFEDPSGGQVVDLPGQVAVFGRREGLVVVAATELILAPRFSNAANPRAALVISSGPGEYEITVDTTRRGRYVFRDTVAAGRYLVSLEVLSTGDRLAGRNRSSVRLPEGPDQTFQISDLLFFLPPSDTVAAANLDDASEAMLGREWVTPDTRLGVYWELYGLVPDEITTLELTATRTLGFLGRIGRFFGVGGDDLVIGWREGAAISPEGIVARSLLIDLSRLGPGRYTIRMKVGVLGQLPVRAERELEIR